MRPFLKLREKFPKLSRMAHKFLKDKDKNKASERESWVIIPDESTEYRLRPRPSWSASEAKEISAVPNNSEMVGNITGSTDDSPATVLDPSHRVELDPDKPKPLVGDRHKENLVIGTELDFIEQIFNGGALPAAYDSVDQPHPSPTSLNSDMPTLHHSLSEKPLPKTPEPSIHDVDFGPPDNVNKDLIFPPSTRYLDTWTKEVLDEYNADPGHDTPFRQFVHRQRVVEWRRYRVRHMFVAPEYRGEYIVVKLQDATETHFLYLDRLIQPNDADYWQNYDEGWLRCVEDEGRPDFGVAMSRKELPENRDHRLIFGLWTPYDRIMKLGDWPCDDVNREGHVFEPDDQPDLLDLFIAARMVHLETSFSMFRRQDHWFTKMLSRVLNQKWDEDDQYSVADKNKFDRRYCLLKGKWDRVPVSGLRHKEILELRKHCNERRENTVSVASTDQVVLDEVVEHRMVARSSQKGKDREGAEIWLNPIQDAADEVKSSRPRKLRKSLRWKFGGEGGI